jgi:hypothetical protein
LAWPSPKRRRDNSHSTPRAIPCQECMRADRTTIRVGEIPSGGRFELATMTMI